MLDRDAVEKALLLGIVRDKNWQVLILNNINKDYFTYANHRLYQYIEDHVNASKYPELAISLIREIKSSLFLNKEVTSLPL